MERRRFGRSGHMSTVGIFGAYAFLEATQADADAAMERVISAGVNHIDVAPFYGLAEERLGPWMARERERFFLCCKTLERTKAGAAAELRRSMRRLQVGYFDLYQIHAVTSFQELDQATRHGGALEAMIQARKAGLARYIGITGHGLDAPAILLEALQRFDFDSVLFPINFIQYASAPYRQNSEKLLQECRSRDVGTMIIKAIARGPWGEGPQGYNTWYRPFTDRDMVQKAVNFVLSQDVTGLCTVGDMGLLPLVLDACEAFSPLGAREQEALIATASEYEPLFD